MAAFVKFQTFIEKLAEAGHNLGSDTLKVALTNTAPTVATDDTLSDITQITAEHGYSAGGSTATLVSSSQTGGTYKLVLTDVTFTASGGSIGPFRYFVLYNDTSATDLLIGYWDFGSNLTLADGQSVTVDFDADDGVIQLA